MARQNTGYVEDHVWKDGKTVTWRLRVHANGERHRITLGNSAQGWNRERAQVELDRITDQIKRGTWRPDRSERRVPAQSLDGETIHVTLSKWWNQKRPELGSAATADYEWRLKLLLGFRPETPTAEIDAPWVDELRTDLSKRKAKNRTAGQTLSPASVNKALDALAAALDLAVDHKVLPANPARGKRRRMRVLKPKRAFLEPDMVVDLLDAAGKWEAALPEHQRYGRRALLALLCLAGPRISEATGADVGDFDLKQHRWRIPESKTPAGERHVELSAFLVAELTAHVKAMKASDRSMGQTSPMFPTKSGGRHNASNVRNRSLAGTIAKVNESRAERDGAMSLPADVTPHALRRTFASLALAAGRDPRWVMAQIGHTDARFTLSVYAQNVQRQRSDRAVIWSLMRFADEPKQMPGGQSFSPMNSPMRRNAPDTRQGTKAPA